MPIRSGLLALAVLFAAGCGAGPTTFGSAQQAYDAGVQEVEEGDHRRAIEHFRAALDFGRTSELADDAQLALARAYAADVCDNLSQLDKKQKAAMLEVAKLIVKAKDDSSKRETEVEMAEMTETRVSLFLRISFDNQFS